jgi:hypothetical protein
MSLKRCFIMVIFTQYVLWALLWGNSTHAYYIFKLQKRIISIIMGARFRFFCRELFKILIILPSQYVFSFTMFVVNNKGLFMEYSALYDIRTRNYSTLYQPSSHLTISQKWPYYIGIKVYCNLTVPKKNIYIILSNFRKILWIFS